MGKALREAGHLLQGSGALGGRARLSSSWLFRSDPGHQPRVRQLAVLRPVSRDGLLQNAVELIQLFPPGAAKNGADIKLCLDATEDIGRFRHIGTVNRGGDPTSCCCAEDHRLAARWWGRQSQEHEQALGQELSRVPLLRHLGRAELLKVPEGADEGSATRAC